MKVPLSELDASAIRHYFETTSLEMAMGMTDVGKYGTAIRHLETLLRGGDITLGEEILARHRRIFEPPFEPLSMNEP